MKTIISNGKVVLTDSIIDNGYVLVEDGRIAAVGEGAPRVEADENINAAGGWISPGLCDIHIHGCGGHWGFFGADDILKMAAALARSGVTAFAPATVSLPHEQVMNSIREIKAAMSKQAAGADLGAAPAAGAEQDGARILGIHLEGPYLNSAQPGAHIPTVIRPPKDAEIDEILSESAGALRIVTMAPEIENGLATVARLVAAGVVVSIGHSDATSEQTRAAISHGASHVTHIFNALRKFHQREPGVAFTMLVEPSVTAEIILDTRHVHLDAVKMAVRTKGPESLALVSDSILAAGMGDGKYNVWGFEVKVKDGIARTPDGTMAGSVVTLNRSVKYAMDLPGLPPQEAFLMATATPYKALRMAGKSGALKKGLPADIAIFDKEMNCAATLIGGVCVYRKQQ